MILKLEFCEPCSILIMSHRSRYGASSSARAVILSLEDCPTCAYQPALRDLISPTIPPTKD